MYARYAEAAARYRPAHTKVVFVQESPPYAPERHFYFTGVRAHDGLWLNLTRFLYGDEFGEAATERARKDHWLRRYQADGYQAIDAVHEPIARHTHGERVEMIRARARDSVAEATAVGPDQVVLVKKSVHDGLLDAYRAAGLNVVNDGPLPFPGRGQQGRFFRTLQHLTDSGKLVL